METADENLTIPSLRSAELAAKLREYAELPTVHHEAKELLRDAAAVLQTTDEKVESYDAARAVVKREGRTRAEYVLRAELAEERVRVLEAALDKVPMPSHDDPVAFWDAYEAACDVMGDT